MSAAAKDHRIGYVGLEVAEAFIQLGLKTTIIELAPQITTNLDPELAQIIEQELTQHGVEVRTGQKVLGFEGNERVTAVITARALYLLIWFYWLSVLLPTPK
ncbi:MULTISPECIES: FAD/NAD(P)-binding oxidoreductase [unclassified Carboxydocella]|uniref:NAD(P)/FAD-dependent oxidoreductase n=1 Tax=unclassified Carboxydocella TaxID=2685367 RepID=UPI001356575C|nr:MULTISPECIES: NAD-binding protein [unclassified Carboxydocella]